MAVVYVPRSMGQVFTGSLQETPAPQYSRRNKCHDSKQGHPHGPVNSHFFPSALSWVTLICISVVEI